MSTKAKILTLAMLSITLQHGHVLSGNYGSTGSNSSNQGYYNQGQNSGYYNQDQNPSYNQNAGYGQNSGYNNQNPNYNVNVEDVNSRNYTDFNRQNDRAHNNQFNDSRDNRSRQVSSQERNNSKTYRADAADATPHSYPLNDNVDYRNNDNNRRRPDGRDDTAYNNRQQNNQNNQNNQNRQFVSDNATVPTTNPNAVNSRPVTPGQNNVAVKGTVVEVLSADPSFSTLVQAITAAGLVDALNAKGPFTIFAPNNQAFQKLPADKWTELMKPENKDKLAAILKYHIIPGKVMASNLVSAKVNSIQGKALDLKVNGSKVTVNNANVTKSDLAGTNGVVHVVDTVLIPN